MATMAKVLGLLIFALRPPSSPPSPPREYSHLANALRSNVANVARLLEYEPIPYIWDVGTIASCRIVWAAKSPVLSLNPCVGARRYSGGDHLRRWTNRVVKHELVFTVAPATVRWYYPGAFVTLVNLMRGRRARTAVNIASAVYILHGARSTWNTFNSTGEGFKELSKEAFGYGLSLGAMNYGAPIDATGGALNLYVAHGVRLFWGEFLLDRQFFASTSSTTRRLGDVGVAASAVPSDAPISFADTLYSDMTLSCTWPPSSATFVAQVVVVDASQVTSSPGSISVLFGLIGDSIGANDVKSWRPCLRGGGGDDVATEEAGDCVGPSSPEGLSPPQKAWLLIRLERSGRKFLHHSKSGSKRGKGRTPDTLFAPIYAMFPEIQGNGARRDLRNRLDKETQSCYEACLREFSELRDAAQNVDQQDPNIMLSLELSLAASGVYQGPQSPHTGRKATLNTRPSLPECSSLLVVP